MYKLKSHEYLKIRGAASEICISPLGLIPPFSECCRFYIDLNSTNNPTFSSQCNWKHEKLHGELQCKPWNSNTLNSPTRSVASDSATMSQDILGISGEEARK